VHREELTNHLGRSAGHYCSLNESPATGISLCLPTAEADSMMWIVSPLFGRKGRKAACYNVLTRKSQTPKWLLMGLKSIRDTSNIIPSP